MSTLIQLKCNDCGATMKLDENKEIIFCPYCGSKNLIVESDEVKIEKIKSEKEIELDKLKYEKELKEQKTSNKMQILLIAILIIFVFVFWSFLYHLV